MEMNAPFKIKFIRIHLVAEKWFWRLSVKFNEISSLAGDLPLPKHSSPMSIGKTFYETSRNFSELEKTWKDFRSSVEVTAANR